MIRRNIIRYWRIRNDRTGSRALSTADDIDRKVIFIQVFYQFDHRDVEIVDVTHVVKACGFLFPEFDRIVIEFFHRHPGISFGKVSGQIFIRKISGTYVRSCLLQFVRYLFRMIDKTILDKHHRIVISIIRLACKRAVHIEHGNTVLDRNEILAVFLSNSFYIGNKRVFDGGTGCPGRQHLFAFHSLVRCCSVL